MSLDVTKLVCQPHILLREYNFTLHLRKQNHHTNVLDRVVSILVSAWPCLFRTVQIFFQKETWLPFLIFHFLQHFIFLDFLFIVCTLFEVLFDQLNCINFGIFYPCSSSVTLFFFAQTLAKGHSDNIWYTPFIFPESTPSIVSIHMNVQWIKLFSIMSLLR